MRALRFFGVIVATVFLSSSAAEAYVYKTCTANDPITWPDGETATFYISKNSIPKDGAAWGAIIDMMTEWEVIGGAQIDFDYTSSDNADGVTITGDTASEIMFISEEYLDEDLDDQYTVMGYATQFWSWSWNEGCLISEADVVFNADVSFNYDSPAGFDAYDVPLSGGNYFRKVALHELGHALGLSHANDYAYMLQGQQEEPHLGDRPFLPLPDDRQAMRYLYPDSSRETDMAASFYEYVADDVNIANLADDQVFKNVCPGDEIQFKKTILNMGTSTTSASITYYFSSDTTVSTRDLAAATDYVTVSASDDYTSTKTLKIPTTLYYGGTYYVGFLLDAADTLAESDESNNAAIVAKVKLASEADCGGSGGTGVVDNTVVQSKFGSAILSAKLNQERSFFDRAKIAKAVYEGEVTKVESFYVGKEIYSDITIAVFETIAGEKKSEVTVRQFGGEIGDDISRVGMSIAELPFLQPGDRIVALLATNPLAPTPFHGGSQGVLRITDKSGYGEVITTDDGRPVIGIRNGAMRTAANFLSLAGRRPVSKQSFIESLKLSVQ